MNLDAIKEFLVSLWTKLLSHLSGRIPDEILNMLGQVPVPLDE